MRNVLTVLLAVAVCAGLAPAALTVVEDFESLTLGSIDMQHEIIEYGFPVEMWNAQRNSSWRGDSGWSNVVAEGPDGSQCVKLTNRDADDNIDTVYTCMYLGDANSIYTTGTIYMQFNADGPNDCMTGGNDLINGYVSDILNDPTANDAAYQNTGNWGSQGPLFRMSGGEDFRAYAGNGSGGGSYNNVPMGQPAGEWQELWLQLDCANQKVRFYVCPLGGTPAVVINPVDSTEWWGWRNTNHVNYAVMNIKWNLGMYPFPDANIETNILIDNIAVDTENYTLDRIEVTIEDKHPGDANGDGTVDIQDFVILKQNYGVATGATFEMGDFNGDGAVDIQDFVILKQNYGWTAS